MEKYCVSLELAQKLKDLEFPQISEYYWQRLTQKEWRLSHYSNFNGVNITGEVEVMGKEMCKSWSEDGEDFIAAPSVGELGEWLPMLATSMKQMEGWLCEAEEELLEEHYEYADTEANARAKMLIYLVENKLLDVKDLV